MKNAREKGGAERLGLHEVRCPDCCKGTKADGARCATCGGTGRLWTGAGTQTLSDARLRRLA